MRQNKIPDDKIITELPLIRRYSRHNEAQDWAFRNYLKLGNVSNQDLDQSVQETTEAVWKEVDCLKCANCCKTLEVSVDDEDIKRLSRRLQINVKVFNQRYVNQAIGPDGLKSLNKQPCVFLGEDNKCEVYEDRPTACRDYPYLYKKNFRNRSMTMIGNVSICPIVFNVWQRIKNQLWLGSKPTKRASS